MKLTYDLKSLCAGNGDDRSSYFESPAPDVTKTSTWSTWIRTTNTYDLGIPGNPLNYSINFLSDDQSIHPSNEVWSFGEQDVKCNNCGSEFPRSELQEEVYLYDGSSEVCPRCGAWDCLGITLAEIIRSADIRITY